MVGAKEIVTKHLEGIFVHIQVVHFEMLSKKIPHQSASEGTGFIILIVKCLRVQFL